MATYGRQLKKSMHEPIEFDEDIDDVNAILKEIEQKDILERRHLAERILNRLQEDDCPSVIGVYGGWGTGKTSLLKLLLHYNNRLDTNKLCVVEIDAWKYESSDSLLTPIVVKFRELTGNEDLPDVWKIIAKRAVATAGLTLVDGLLHPFGLGSTQILSLYEKMSSLDDQESYITVLERWERQSEVIEQTEKAFEKLVELAIQKQNGKRILICIDNLDRCSPDNVVKLLESIKVFFSAPGCTWLFAMDSDVVAGYIHKKYQDTGVDGYSYLDKIIPEQYHLSLSPASDQKIIYSLLRYAAGNVQYQIDIEKIPQIPKILVPRRLIKSARKYSDFYRGRFSSLGVPPEIIMALSLLYHTWPGFYQRLSSSSAEHVRGILDNFFSNKDLPNLSHDRFLGGSILLHQTLLQDNELTYFIQTVFSGYNSDSSDKYVRDILNGIKGLRDEGLP